MKFAIISLLLSFFSVKSCEKKTNNCDCKLEGIWEGTYTVDQIPGQGKLEYNLILKTDGTLIAEGKGNDQISYYSSGSWILKGSELTCNFRTINFPYAEVSQTASFNFDINSCKLTNGRWKDIKEGSNTGSFNLNKK